MAPFKDHTSKVLDLGVKNLKIVVRQVVPSTSNDFITTDGVGNRTVNGFFGNTTGRLAVDAFYLGSASRVNITLGDNLFVKNSAGISATIVHLK